MEEDSLSVYEYLIDEMKLSWQSILVMGRSIGSGPAVYLANVKKVQSLILLSAFLSLKEVVQDFLGKHLAALLRDRFANKDRIQNVSTNILFIHGQKDNVVSQNHSKKMYCLNALKDVHDCFIKTIVLPKNMTHVEFDF